MTFAEAPSETEGASAFSPAQSTPQIDPANEYTAAPLSDEEIYVGLAAEIEATKLMLVKMAEQGDFRGAGVLSETIMGLEQQKESLYDFLYKQNIQTEDILFVRQQIPGYTSVLNLTEEQKAACVKLEQLFAELGGISPFARRENDVLEREQTRVPVIRLEDKYDGETDANAIIKRSNANKTMFLHDVYGKVHRNDHTDWNIQVVRKSFDETFNSAIRKANRKNADGERIAAQLSALHSLSSLTKHAILLDSVLTDMHGGKNKNSMFMHHLYCPYQLNEHLYIAELTVEHWHGHRPSDRNASEDQKRLYHVKGVKIIPAVTPLWVVPHGETAGIMPNTASNLALPLDERGSSKDTVSSTISISQLHQIVKNHYQDYYPNTQNAKNGRAAREVELYNHARYADAQAALDAEAETVIPRETEAQVEAYAQDRQIAPEEAAAQLAARAAEQEKLRPITKEARSRILEQFAAENGLKEVFVYRANKGGKASPREYFICAKESGKYVLREPLFTLENGEIFSEKTLADALESFKSQIPVSERPRQESLFDGQPIYTLTGGVQEELRVDGEPPAMREAEAAHAGDTAEQSVADVLNAEIVNTIAEKIPEDQKAWFSVHDVFLTADDDQSIANNITGLVGRYALRLREGYGEDTPEYAHLSHLSSDSTEARTLAAKIANLVRREDKRVTNDTNQAPAQKRPYAIGDTVFLEKREFRISEIGDYCKPPMDELDQKFMTYGRTITLEDKSFAGWYPITRSIYQAELEASLVRDERNAGYATLGYVYDSPAQTEENRSEEENALPQSETEAGAAPEPEAEANAGQEALVHDILTQTNTLIAEETRVTNDTKPTLRERAEKIEQLLRDSVPENGFDASEDEEEAHGAPAPTMPDYHEYLREVLNEFSLRHGLGELYIEQNSYENRLYEKMKDGKDLLLGSVESVEYNVPHTPETLEAALKKFEDGTPDLSSRHGRAAAIERLGGITPLPAARMNLPEIVYASNPDGRFYENLEAIRELSRLERMEENGRPLYDRYNTKEDSEARLSRYCGWGGLSQVFDKNNSTWSRNRETLKELLSAEDYDKARASTLDSFYTPQIVIDAMYAAVKKMDLPQNARVLEPSCGTGNFIRRMPSALRGSELVGVEIDNLTARIARRLNEDATILHSGFEETDLPNNSFDLAIGNVPFGDYNLIDRDYTQNWRIHDAFFRKALDKVAPGGLVAFVTSSGTLDKSSPKVREYLAERAELVGAVRLPNNAFSNAGTKVTSDIVFLKKRETPLEKTDKKPDWCYTIPNADGLRINAYFVQNPQMILGKMEKTSHYNMLTCVPEEGASLQAQLNAAMRYINAKITISKREAQLERQAGVMEPWGKNFSFSKGEDGKLYYRQVDKMIEQKGTAPQLKRLGELCELRTVARTLIEAQRAVSDDSKLKPVRDLLNTLYDAYRETYGQLNTDETKRIFGEDSDCPLLLGLENFYKETGKWMKADIFSKRTVNPQMEITSAKTVVEALQISLDRRGKPDIAYIAALVDANYPDLRAKAVCERVCAELLESGAVFVDPEKQIPGYPYSGIVERAEYLSGNVREKLSAAEQARLRGNVEALKTVIPKDIKAEEITVRIGTPWIEAGHYTEFLRHISGRSNRYNQRKCDVHYSTATGEFDVMNAGSKKDLNPAESTVYGTKDYSLYQLAEKLLNQRRIVVKKEIPNPKDPAMTKTVTDAKATRAALEKAKSIKAEFQKWIFSDETRRAYYERKYNDTFNCLVGREYDGRSLTFAGMNSDFRLRDHQKNAIARAVSGGNTLAAHVVGAGKSAVIFASVMRKKELGLINKACVVVPKALTEQTANEWRRLYPDAKILTVTAEDLNNEQKRKLFTARVATGSYDAVILSREQFEKIPMSHERRIAYLRKEYDELADMLIERKRENRGKGDVTVKELEKAKKRLKAKLDNLINPKGKAKEKDNLLEFEQLGFDFLAVDEAHAYKNGFVVTKMTDVAGVTTRPSGRAEDMQMKCDFLNEEFGQGHILMATGTPVSNSMTELYVMTRYLRPDLLAKAGVSRFDDWAATFGNVTTALEPTAYDTFKLKTRFSQFANLPELMAFYKEFADIKSAQMLDLPRPKLEGGKNIIVNVPASPEQKDYVRQLAERAEAINAGLVEPYEDNFLKITGEARLVGLGNQAVKALYQKTEEGLPPEFTDPKNGKLDVCVDNVHQIRSETKAVSGVQIIFSDIAINDDKGNFSAYKYVKDELVSRGIPEKEIVFAPKANSNNREDIFKKINAGEYRVVIASTETLGTGANIQKKLCALHHLDIPWKPSCFEQREGRILRQGNENPIVKIFNYVTQGTLDSYLYSTVTNKARFIAQLLDNDAPARVCEDCDEKVLTYAEIQAVAAGNPDIKRQIEAANKLAELRMLKREWAYEISRLKAQTEALPMEIKGMEQRLSGYKVDSETAKALGGLTLTAANGGKLSQGGDIDRLIHAKVKEAIKNYDKGIKTPVAIGNVGSFALAVIAVPVLASMEKEAYIIIKGAEEYRLEAGILETGNAMRLKNFFLGNKEDGKPSVLDRRVADTAGKIHEMTENLKQASEAALIPFAHTEELAKTEEDLAALEEKLSAITSQEEVVGIDSDEIGDEFDEAEEEKAQREALYCAVTAKDENDYEPVPEENEGQKIGGR